MHEITLTMPEDSRVVAIGDIKTKMQNTLDTAGTGSAIILDLRKIRHADSALAQLIVSFKTESLARGFSVMIKEDQGDFSLPALLCCDTIIEPGAAGRQDVPNPGGVQS